MWTKTRLTERLSITYPLIQAPMAGGATTPELVAAVADSGGLGALAAGYLPPEQIQRDIQAIRQRTDRPFAVNLFIPEPVDITGGDPDAVEQSNRLLHAYRSELGLQSPPTVTRIAQPFDEQMAAVLEAQVPVFSFTFGILPAEWVEKLHAVGTVLMGTATTVSEAVALEQAGIDMVVAQGSEAGGHRGTFLEPVENSLTGTLALVPQIVDAVQVPVIASGGIMDGRGVVAVLALGAAGAQMGTAFLACPESGINATYRAALLEENAEVTVLTRAFSGKHARGIRNRFITEVQPYEDSLPPYPIQNALTRDVRQAAAEKDRADCMSLWAGQGRQLISDKPASVLVADVVTQVEMIVAGLGGRT